MKKFFTSPDIAFVLAVLFVLFFTFSVKANEINFLKAPITESSIQKAAEKNENVVIVMSNEYCGPCRMLELVIRRIKDTQVVFYSGEYGDFPKKYQATGATPTLLFFKNGKYIGRIVGAMSPDQLKELLKNTFKEKDEK